MPTMNWDKLLCPTRTRALMGKSASTGDHRTEFQRDFDRVVFSSPLRRLQDKTQVFPLEPNDAVRTRLTHSLEVSAVARGMAERICSSTTCADSKMKTHASEIETIAATVGLVHDLGNPPFGHFGEEAISEWFRTALGERALEPLAAIPELHSDFTRFEGNARTLRLLCSLQILTDRFGLNLTAATTSATMKYTAQSHEAGKGPNQGKKKPGFLYTEKEVVSRVREATGTDDARHPIAFVVEAADDCVYSLCDLEDAVRKGVLTWSELTAAISSAAHQKVPHHASDIDALTDEVLKEVKDKTVASGIAFSESSRDHACVQVLRVKAASRVVEGVAAAFEARYAEIISGTFGGDLVSDPTSGLGGAIVIACKAAARQRVYGTRKNTELELRGRRVMLELLDELWPGVAFSGKDGPNADLARRDFGRATRAWALLSENYRSVFVSDMARIDRKSAPFPVPALEQYYRLLLLTDYVGGMTDTFASTMHRSLTNG